MSSSANPYQPPILSLDTDIEQDSELASAEPLDASTLVAINAATRWIRDGYRITLFLYVGYSIIPVASIRGIDLVSIVCGHLIIAASGLIVIGSCKLRRPLSALAGDQWLMLSNLSVLMQLISSVLLAGCIHRYATMGFVPGLMKLFTASCFSMLFISQVLLAVVIRPLTECLGLGKSHVPTTSVAVGFAATGALISCEAMDFVSTSPSMRAIEIIVWLLLIAALATMLVQSKRLHQRTKQLIRKNALH